MKKRSKNIVLRISAVISILILLLTAALMGMVYYIFYIPEPEGLSLASWPSIFTDNFAVWLDCEDGKLNVEGKRADPIR